MQYILPSTDTHQIPRKADCTRSSWKQELFQHIKYFFLVEPDKAATWAEAKGILADSGWGEQGVRVQIVVCSASSSLTFVSCSLCLSHLFVLRAARDILHRLNSNFPTEEVVAPSAEAIQRQVAGNFPRDAAVSAQIIWTLTHFWVGLFKCLLSEFGVFCMSAWTKMRGESHFVCPSFWDSFN